MAQTHFERVVNVHKIAAIRVNALGDFICALPALEALRAAYPDAEIVLLAKKWTAIFMKDRPGPINRVVVVPPYGGVGVEPGSSVDALEIESFFHTMRQEHFDLAIQMHGGGRYSNRFVRRIGARMSVGSKTPDAEPLDRSLPYIFFQQEILRQLEVVSLVGATVTNLEPCITVTESDLNEAHRVFDSTLSSDKLVALHPGASDPRRRWPAEKFAAVGDALASRGAQIVITGTPEEQDLANAIVNAMQTSVRNLCGFISLGGLAGLLSRCRLVVSNDSGPLHLAAAVGTATVGIYWCFNLLNYAPLTRAHHRPIASWRLTCPNCGNDVVHEPCNHHDSLVADISTDEVISAALDLFSD
jgi:ADP-heptose:LPS heptosyltransferase